MKKKTCVAMLLAGGQGSRLGVLTKTVAKPAKATAKPLPGKTAAPDSGDSAKKP